MQPTTFNIERVQHYVYIVLLYMFLVGYFYFYSFFSAFRFNAIGFVGFIDIIKMAASGLFKVPPLVYLISASVMLSCIVKFKINIPTGTPLENNSPSEIGRFFMLKVYNNGVHYYISFVLVSFAYSFFSYLKSSDFDNYQQYSMICVGGMFLASTAAVSVSFIFNSILISLNPTNKRSIYLRTLIFLYLIECGFMSYLAGHNDATRIILGKEFTYKVSVGNGMNERFLWSFGNTLILWDKSNKSILISKKEDVTEYKYYREVQK